jgi:hypothetical protein
MSETAKSVITILAILVGLPVLILWGRDRASRAWWRRRNPPEKIAAERRAYEARILKPDWAFYERHLQRPAPEELRELYADRALIIAQDLDYSKSDRISTFDPLDEEGLLETQPWLGFDAVAIATTDFGDPIYLRPGAAEPDVVYVTHHDGGDTEVLAESVAAMVERVRQANPPARLG